MAAFVSAPVALGVRTPAVPAIGRIAGDFGGVRVTFSRPPTRHNAAASDVATTVASATPVPPSAPLTRRTLLRTASAAAAVAAVAATGVARTRPRAPAGVYPTPAELPVAPVPLWVRTVAPAAASPTVLSAATTTASLPRLPVLVFIDAATPEGYTATYECSASAGRAVTSVAAAVPSSSSPTAVAAAAVATDIGRGASFGGAAAAALPRQVHVVGGGGAAARAAVAYAAAVGRVGVASLTLEAPRLGADAFIDDVAWEAVLADVYRPAAAAAASASVPLGATASGGWTVATPTAVAGPAAVADVDAAVPAGNYRAALFDLIAAGLPVAVVRSAADADVTVWMANVSAEGAAPREGPWACVGAAGGTTRTEAWGGWHSAAPAERAAFVAALNGMYDRIERA